MDFSVPGIVDKSEPGGQPPHEKSEGPGDGKAEKREDQKWAAGHAIKKEDNRRGSPRHGTRDPGGPAGKIMGRIGEFLVGQLASVVDANGGSIGIDPAARVDLHVSGGEEGGMQAFPQGHRYRVGFHIAAVRALRQFGVCKHDRMGRQKLEQFIDGTPIRRRQANIRQGNQHNDSTLSRGISRREEGFHE